MIINYVYLYLLSPLHTGGTTQEGNLVGIARESHTQLPYIPSSSIRGRLRANIEDLELRKKLFGPELEDITGNNDQNGNKTDKSNASQLKQGDIWIGDGSLLWIPVPSLSHGVVWVSCPMLLKRWARLQTDLPEIPSDSDKLYYTNIFKEKSEKKQIFLKDARITADKLSLWSEFDISNKFIPSNDIEQVLLIPNRHFATITQMSLWRQVKIKLNEHKSVDGGFRYEEAIPPDTVMYFPWGITSQTPEPEKSRDFFIEQLKVKENKILQIGGQESLGRGFVRQWLKPEETDNKSTNKQLKETQKS